MSPSGESAHPIECPGHGPMERLTYQGVVVRIQCRFCGQRPLDLLQREHFGVWPNLTNAEGPGDPNPFPRIRLWGAKR